jgi:hypothetical protein
MVETLAVYLILTYKIEKLTFRKVAIDFLLYCLSTDKEDIMSTQVTLNEPTTVQDLLPKAEHKNLKQLLAKLQNHHLIPPQNSEWAWDNTDPVTPEEKARMIEFFKQNASYKPTRPKTTESDDFFA